MDPPRPPGVPDQHIGPAYWTYTLNGTSNDEEEIYRPRFFTYGFRYLLVTIGANGPPGPAPPLPKGTRFIGSGAEHGAIWFEHVAKNGTHMRNHVHTCSMCGINICSSFVHVTEAYVQTLTRGIEFNCTMVTPPTPTPPSPSPADKVEILDLTGEFVYNAAPIVANWSCSEDILNSIHQMILQAMKSNLQSVFHDCPHRERLGWLEQSWLLAKSVGHNFDLSGIYSKIADDIAEAQLSNGMVPSIAPEYPVFSGGFRDSPEWGIAFVMVPIFLLDQYNDTATIGRHYDGMMRYIDYLQTKADPHTGIIAYGLGDWGTDGDRSPKGVTGTMVFVEACQNLARVASGMGKTADAKRLIQAANKSIAGYTKTYLDSSSGGYAHSTTATAMPLALGLAPDPAATSAFLRAHIGSLHNHSNSGEIGWPYVVRALGKSDPGLLHSIVTKTDQPSYVLLLLSCLVIDTHAELMFSFSEAKKLLYD